MQLADFLTWVERNPSLAWGILIVLIATATYVLKRS